MIQKTIDVAEIMITLDMTPSQLIRFAQEFELRISLKSQIVQGQEENINAFLEEIQTYY
jgi:bifunctional DNase/RNase